ncbi:MAG: thiamine biosynthesis protein ThiH [Bacteroidia bacterium]|nr:MAG: thiamine biosynthesis protein ThiH [Bacteroidia bacterium]
MKTFYDIYQQTDFKKISNEIEKIDDARVERALAAKYRNLEDFMALLSPAAVKYLPYMLQEAGQITAQRFGKTVQIFIPMYLSNTCTNICTYCGFSFSNKLPRKILTKHEIEKEIEYIKQWPFEHILLVTGEDNHKVGVEYLLDVLPLFKQNFSQVSIEVQPLDTEEYEKLHQAGVYAVLVYQETYHESTYKKVHPKGKKSNIRFRLETPDRIGRAGMHKIGLGVLLGLDDWRADSYFNALHIDYLQNRYWKAKYSVSFPRIRPHEGDKNFVPQNVTDKNLVQLIAAYRLWNPDLELSLSTRENKNIRDNAFMFGITSMSAFSKTNPGGYAVEPDALEQFSTEDQRKPEEIARMIQEKGYDPVWKDWDFVYDADAGIHLAN